QSSYLGHRRALAINSSRQPSSVRVSLRSRCCRPHLLCRFPLMVLFTIFCPIVAAVLIMLGAPARKTALAASAFTFAAALFLFASLDHGHADFQHVTSFSISPEWRLGFITGVDGLSAIMVLLASVVTLAAVWFAGTIERYENAFYACLLFISGGAIGAFASID